MIREFSLLRLQNHCCSLEECFSVVTAICRRTLTDSGYQLPCFCASNATAVVFEGMLLDSHHKAGGRSLTRYTVCVSALDGCQAGSSRNWDLPNGTRKSGVIRVSASHLGPSRASLPVYTAVIVMDSNKPIQ